MIAAEPHAVRLLALLERDDELVVGLAGLHENMVVILRQTKSDHDQKVADGKDSPAHEPREEW